MHRNGCRQWDAIIHRPKDNPTNIRNVWSAPPNLSPNKAHGQELGVRCVLHAVIPVNFHQVCLHNQ